MAARGNGPKPTPPEGIKAVVADEGIGLLRNLALSCNNLAAKLNGYASEVARGESPLDMRAKRRVGADLRELEREFGSVADKLDPPLPSSGSAA